MYKYENIRMKKIIVFLMLSCAFYAAYSMEHKTEVFKSIMQDPTAGAPPGHLVMIYYRKDPVSGRFKFVKQEPIANAYANKK